MKQETDYLVAVSPTAAYLQRTYRWWRYTFPEYVLPSPMPDPPEAPGPSGRAPPPHVPAEKLRRKVALWEKKLDNVLLFGHTLPTNQEVAYRRSYLSWCDLYLRHCLLELRQRVRAHVLDHLSISPAQRDALMPFAGGPQQASPLGCL